MARLSAEMPSRTRGIPRKPEELNGRAHALLESAVRKSVVDFREALSKADEHTRGNLVAFIQQPYVGRAAVWQTLFGARPPRGAVERIARRLRVELHETVAFRNFRTLAALKREIRRVPRWYAKGKRETRYRRGLQRGDHTGDQVRGLQCAWTKKTKEHYRRLLDKEDLDKEAHGKALEINRGTASRHRHAGEHWRGEASSRRNTARKLASMM